MKRISGDSTWESMARLADYPVILSPKSELNAADKRSADEAETNWPAQVDRRATGFIVTVPFGKPISGREYVHTYMVTALHCAAEIPSFEPRGLWAEGNWMGRQGGGRSLLAEEDWSFFTSSEAQEFGDEIVDLAIQSYKGNLYFGEVIGKATRAVPVQRFARVERDSYDDSVPLGLKTFTVGLFKHYKGGSQIEPAVLGGSLACVPYGPISSPGRFVAGIERLETIYLIEGRASGGMSGAPVFIGGDDSDPLLLGVHSGHFVDAEGGAANHANMGIVVPAYRLHQLLHRKEARESRALIEAELRSQPQLLLSNSESRERGVACAEVRWESDTAYHEGPSSLEPTVFMYPSDGSGVRPDRFLCDEIPFSELHAVEFGDINSVRSVLEQVFDSVIALKQELDLLASAGNHRVYCRLHLNESDRCVALDLRFGIEISDARREHICEEIRSMLGVGSLLLW